MTAFGLFKHSCGGVFDDGSSETYFLGEHVMAEDSRPVCGTTAALVGRSGLEHGFAVVCRVCLAGLIKKAARARARARTRKEKP